MAAFISRIAVYFSEMFPIIKNGFASIIIFFSFMLMCQLQSNSGIKWYPAEWFGPVSILLLLILTRLFDELKDEGVEAEYFPNRPLVTGRVKYDDIRILALIIIWLLTFINLGRGIATSGFLFMIIMLFLSWQWWLFPNKVQPSITLLFLTHQTLVPAMGAYMYTVFLYVSGDNPNIVYAAVLCVIFWFPMMAWEFGRKIRSADMEDEYPTYSKKWGITKASLIPVLAILATAIGFAATGYFIGLSLFFVIFNFAAAIICIIPILRFVKKPVAKNNYVKQAVETYIFLYQISIFVEAGRRFL